MYALWFLYKVCGTAVNIYKGKSIQYFHELDANIKLDDKAKKKMNEGTPIEFPLKFGPVHCKQFKT